MKVENRDIAWSALRSLLLCLSLVATAAGCANAERCQPGAMRTCQITVDGGYRQSGYQSCASYGTWSDCVSVGACASSSGATLPLYSRCQAQTDCGPESCGVCGNYAGVQNPNAYSVCYAFCQQDSDCAPTVSVRNVTPTCILGQCALLCHTTSQCPGDSQCLAWQSTPSDPTFSNYDGLCE